jgi:hypothetical protein
MPDITLSLTDDEALVLFDFLARFTLENLLGIEDQSEQRVLWDLHCMLERQLGPIFDPQYHDLLNAARTSLRDEHGTNAEAERTAGRIAFWLDPGLLAFVADEWRKLPGDLPDEDQRRWSEIAFRAMSALHKFGIDYTARVPNNGYHLGDPHNDKGGSVTLTS